MESLQRLWWWMMVAGILILGIDLVQPIASTANRIAFAAGLFFLVVGVLGISWHQRVARVVLLVLIAAALLPFLAPGRDIQAERLRARYLSALRSYEGSPYLWGGEGRLGIDCSGLPRRAMRDALFAEGYLTLNGRALRLWFDLWRHDTTAKGLGQGYREWTEPTHQRAVLRYLDLRWVEPGDIAVTRGGAHALVYLGDGRWLQAEPGAGKVISGNPGTEDNVWFSADTSVYRWKWLQPG